ncbi:hypothetical protein WJM95_35230 [Streptomyces sp. f51]|uniref:zinc finger domain-containing protein n=1 Tax=Streptomyces sp. f51 TaxID=1827742 RepID=UPI0030CDF7C1
MTAACACDTDDVERHECPRCGIQPGSPCRSRSGAVAGIYRTGRFKNVARLANCCHGLVLEMQTGPLPGSYDPTGPGKLLFAFFAAMAVISSSDQAWL